MSLLPLLVLGLIGAACAAFWLGRQPKEFARFNVRILLGLGALLAGAMMSATGAPVIGGPIGLLGLSWVVLAARQKRQARQGGRRQPPPRTEAGMSVQQACDVLGVKPDATEAEIREAHRRLMKRVHPDTGSGATELARQVQTARDLLLERLSGSS